MNHNTTTNTILHNMMMLSILHPDQCHSPSIFTWTPSTKYAWFGRIERLLNNHQYECTAYKCILECKDMMHEMIQKNDYAGILDMYKMIISSFDEMEYTEKELIRYQIMPLGASFNTFYSVSNLKLSDRTVSIVYFILSTA